METGTAIPRPEVVRRWRPVVLVALLITVVVSGGYLVAEALSVPTGSPVGFQGIVRVDPLSGWAEAGRSTTPIPAIRLSRGGANFDIAVVSGAGTDAPGLARLFVDRVLSRQLIRPSISGRLQRVTLAPSTVAVRFGYVGLDAASHASIEGEVTVLVTPAGDGVIFDAWASGGLLRSSLGDVHTMEDDAGFFV